MSSRVSLADVLAAGVLLHPAEAATIVAEVCGRIIRGDLRGVPSPHVLRISASGELTTDGPIAAHRATIARAAQLLDDLLAPAEGHPEYRAPGPLRLALLRARGNVDLPSFSGLNEFATTLRRFAGTDIEAVVGEVFARWQQAVPAADQNSGDETSLVPATVLPVTLNRQPERDLTVSDIRRARRATGLTLNDVSERSRIPAALLRELEWGYLWNWPDGLYGRSQLVRYARAAGLDEQIVVAAVWPLLEEMAEARGGELVEAVPAEETIDVVLPLSEAALAARARAVEPIAPARSGRSAPRRRMTALVAAAAVALAIVPAAFWNHSRDRSAADSPSVQTAADTRLPAATHQPPAAAAPAAAPPVATPPVHRTAIADRQVAASLARSSAPAADALEPVRAIPASAVYSPTFSNAGTAMFFHEEEGAHSALVRADTDTRGTVLKITRVLDDKAQNFHARPSPDGSAIAFDSDRDGVRAVYVADADGHNVRRVSGEGFAAVPSWAPDGSRLAFVKGEPDAPDVWNLWIADLASGGLKQVTSYKYGQPWGGSWFPDGRHIAYSHETDLIIQDLATGSRRTYHSPIRGRLLRTPAVSPDGRRIIFQVYRDGTWLLNLATGSMRRVLDDPTAEEYTWAPDGHRVAFHSRRSGGWGVWVMSE